MKILYILKQDPDATLDTIISIQKKDNETNVFDLRTDKNYDGLVDLIDASDKIIPW